MVHKNNYPIKAVGALGGEEVAWGNFTYRTTTDIFFHYVERGRYQLKSQC